MKSLLYSDNPPFELPPGCALGERVEVPVTIRKGNRMYRMILRDKIVPEDLLIIYIKAVAFAVKQQEPYMGRPITRSVKDFLIKQSTII